MVVWEYWEHGRNTRNTWNGGKAVWEYRNNGIWVCGSMQCMESNVSM